MLKALMLRTTLIAFTCSLSFAAHAMADDLKHFDIPAGDLTVALESLARQSGAEFVYQADQLRGLHTPGVSGTLSAEQAVTKLLQGTRLQVRMDASGAMVIALPRASASGAPKATPSRESNTSAADTAPPRASEPRKSFWSRFRLAEVEQGPSVGATTAPGSDGRESVVLEEVLVTAQKREERIQDVPFAITAVTQREIRERGAVDIKDLQYSVPGLNIQELQPGANRITMRGINPGISTGLPIVAVYVDEVGINLDQQQRDGVFPLVDIDRVEVLRGPQGTLYGQGSIAGTIRYITRNPDLDKTEGFLETNVYSQEDGGIGYRANGAVGLPLIDDRVGLRISGGYDHLAGWIDYPAENLRNVNDTERKFVRPKLFARLTDDLTLSLLYQYYDQESDTDAVSSVGSPTVRPGKTRLYPASDRSHLGNAILSYDLGSATLLSSTGYQHRDLHFTAAIATFKQDSPGEYEQFSQELRLTSNGNDRIRYTAGAWYRKFLSNVNRILYDANGNPTAVARKQGNDPVDSESKAVFGDLTFAATDQLSLSVGGRYYWDTRENDSTIPLLNNEADFSSFSPRASLKYSWTSDISSYATISKGFRSGGFNNSGTSYGPESLWNYEIGTKALLGSTFYVDVAGYYLDYKNRQAQTAIQTSPGVFFSETRSVGKASGFGLEGAVGAQLPGSVRLDITAAYNDVTSDVTNTEVVKGQRFDFVPKFTGSVALSQRIPVSSRVSALWRLDYQHSAPYASIIRQGLANGSVLVLENFTTQSQDYLNARVGLAIGPLEVLLDAQNILNEDSILFPFSPITTTNEGVRARPRSYGITVRRDFGL